MGVCKRHTVGGFCVEKGSPLVAGKSWKIVILWGACEDYITDKISQVEICFLDRYVYFLSCTLKNNVLTQIKVIHAVCHQDIVEQDETGIFQTLIKFIGPVSPVNIFLCEHTHTHTLTTQHFDS